MYDEQEHELSKLSKKGVQHHFLEKMKQKAGKNKPNVQSETQQTVNHKPRNKEDKSLQARLDKIQKELLELKSENKEQKNVIKELKERIYIATTSERSHVQTIETMKVENKELKAEVSKLSQQKSGPNNKRVQEHVTKLEREKNRLRAKLQTLMVNKTAWLKEIKTLKKRIENNTIIEQSKGYEEELKRLKETLRLMFNEVRPLKDKLAWLESSDAQMDIAKAISLLYENISYASIDSYPRILALAKHLTEMVNNYEQDKKYRKLAAAQRQSFVKKQIEDIQFGYVGLTEQGYVFTSIENDQKYNAVGTLNNFEEGMPVKVKIESGNATVLNSYNTKTQPPRKYRSSRQFTSIAVPKRRKGQPKLGDFSVLIVGLRNKYSYMHALTSIGINSVWHDPIEESYDRLKAKVGKADIVLVCTGHIPHAVLYTIDSISPNNPKVDHIYHDNADRILARIRFMAVNLGLIKTGVTA